MPSCNGMRVIFFMNGDICQRIYTGSVLVYNNLKLTQGVCLLKLRMAAQLPMIHEPPFSTLKLQPLTHEPTECAIRDIS